MTGSHLSATPTQLSLVKDVKDTLKKGKFNLSKWCSNSRDICEQMQDDQLRSSSVKVSIKEYLEFTGAWTKTK